MKKIIEELMKECRKACKKEEVPVGCLIVENGKIISKAHNTKQSKGCCLNHAEILAIQKASKKNKDWRLDNCELYVTLEPCKMCNEVIKQSRIKKVWYLLESKFNDNNKEVNAAAIENYKELKEEYLKMLQDFFRAKR